MKWELRLMRTSIREEHRFPDRESYKISDCQIER